MNEKEDLSEIDKRVLIELYKVQWNDIHDMNNLDWRITLIFIPLIGAVSFVFGIAWQSVSQQISIYTEAIQAISFISFLISLYGLWTVAKGQVHQALKFKTLGEIERRLGLEPYMKHKKRSEEYRFKSFWPSIIARRSVLYLVYLFLGFLSYSMIVTPITKWHLSSVCQRPDIILIPTVLALLILAFQWRDYRLYLPRKGNSREKSPH